MPALRCFPWILLFSLATRPTAFGGPLPRSTTASITPTVMTTTPTSEATTLPDRQQPSWPQEGSVDGGGLHSSSPTLISLDPGCRKRVVCEAARTLTYIFPLSKTWQGIVRERPTPQNTYFAAWSKGLQGQDCSHLYPDCSDSPAALVLPVINQAVGPKGFVGTVLERLVLPRDSGAPSRSLVMQKLREGERRLPAEVPHNQYEDFTFPRT